MYLVQALVLFSFLQWLPTYGFQVNGRSGHNPWLFYIWNWHAYGDEVRWICESFDVTECGVGDLNFLIYLNFK